MFVLATFSASAAPLPDYPFIYAEGKSKTEIQPDICTITFYVTIRDTNASSTLSRITQHSSDALKIIETNGVKPEDIIAFEISKEHVRDYSRNNKFTFLGYEMKRKIELTLKDLQKYAPIMSALMKMPNVVDVSSEFDRADREKIESKLLGEAVASAKSKVEVMAGASGQRIKSLRALSSDDLRNIEAHFGLSNITFNRGIGSSYSSEDQKVIFIPSSIKFSSSVSVIYEVEVVK